MTEAPAEDAAIDLLDANPVLRYLLADHPEQFVRSCALIESDRRFRISVVTLAEIGYVLTGVAGVSRGDAVDTMIDLLERENIEAHEVDTDLAVEALMLCRPSGRVNFGDAMLWAVARAATPARVWTLDQHFPDSGIEVHRP